MIRPYLFFAFLFISSPAWAHLNLDRLPQKDIDRVQRLLAKIEPVVSERQRRETLAKLTFEDLYQPLDRSEKKFLKQFKNLDARKLSVTIPFRGIATGREPLVPVRGQVVFKDGKYRELPVQYLPPKVHAAYMNMMNAMQRDIGKRLYVESGYRSSAYQLYLFIYYLKNHEYSIRETVKFVALPGYSEHGSVKYQAIDFINKEGINGEYNPQEFEDLPENKWLLKNAGRFGFVLSYPRRAHMTYEPWHWRYEGKKVKNRK